MPPRQSRLPSVSPKLWLISDARNDARLEHILERLPRGAGFIYRHYHLDDDARHRHFIKLVRICTRRGLFIILAGTAKQAQKWGADGMYGPPDGVAIARRNANGRSTPFLTLATAHNPREIRQANKANADFVLVSPVFATRSHADGKPLGPMRFAALARLAKPRVIALGGVNRHSFTRVSRIIDAWAAIDGLSR